jgi:hypothetical protein
MKRILLLFTLALSTIASFAQQPDSLLKQFRYRIDNFRAVTISGNGESQYNKLDYVNGAHTNSASAGSAGGNYNITKSTDRISLTAVAGMYGSFNRAKSNDQSNSYTSKNFSYAPQLSIVNKWFHKKMFTELGTTATGLFYSFKDITAGFPDPSKNNINQYSVAITLGAGTGRLENITDMQNALWLYKELMNSDRIGAILTADDLLELGRSITKGNNTRVLDSRKRTQFLLRTVDNYLQQKKIISKTDMAYFSGLNDILFFAFNSPRLSGTEKFIRLTPGITGWKNNQYQANGIDKLKHDFNTQSLLLSAGFKKYIPTSLKHQDNFGAALQLAYSNADLNERFFSNGIVTNEVKGTTQIKQAGGNAFYNHAIYPNTRTVVDCNLQTELGYQDVDNKNFYAAANATVSLNYFINYNTRLTCNAGAYYQKNKYAMERYVEFMPDAVQLSVGAGVVISL